MLRRGTSITGSSSRRCLLVENTRRPMQYRSIAIVISYRCSTVTESVSPAAVFQIFGLKHIRVTIITFQGNVTLSGMRPFDTQGTISYRCYVVIDSRFISLSPAVFEIMGPNVLGSRTWPFRVTWRHRSRDHSIRHIVISYWWSVGTKTVSPTVFKTFGPNTC